MICIASLKCKDAIPSSTLSRNSLNRAREIQLQNRKTKMVKWLRGVTDRAFAFG